MTATPFDEDALDAVYSQALADEKAGRSEAAAKAYRACLDIDPDDHVGARLRLAAIGMGETPASAGDAYVTTLFDQQAEMFEDILVRQLHYGVPELIAEGLSEAGLHHFDRALDLGCGTGLVGAALDGRADEMLGVDLSEKMVEIAFDGGAYDNLYIGEALEFLGDFDEDEPFDLITAADVLPYFGDLSAFFGAVVARLSPGGVFVASSETFDPADSASVGNAGSAGKGNAAASYGVGRDHRFHHGEAYLRQALESAGFSIVAFEAIIVRMEEGKPAPGHLFIARRTA